MLNNEELINKINIAANLIAKKSRQGDANFIIVSPQVARVFEQLNLKHERRRKLNEIFKNQKTSE